MDSYHNENVIFTTSGGFNPIDFWSTSALTSLATDPIDVSASSKQPAILWDAVEVNNGLVLVCREPAVFNDY